MDTASLYATATHAMAPAQPRPNNLQEIHNKNL